jgi:MoxR-like ATPase
VSVQALTELQASTRAVKVDAALADYVLDLVGDTRTHPDVALGASTRAALGLYRAAQANALTQGRDYVVPDDVKGLAEPVLAHRLVGRGWAAGGSPDAGPVVREIVAKRRVPT